MCDTVVALPNCTTKRTLLFGKNSDRQRNEAQALEYWPAAEFIESGEQVCTYIKIPRARRRHAVLLCRPFWIWGAEMGANEHGVVIGNEGIHACSRAPEHEALTGMDLVRLALERSESARQAVQVITSLLGEHGQGGNCGHLTPSYYNNSFLIADATEAIVLETIGREWMSEQVHGIHAISNCYSIECPEHVSAGIPHLIKSYGCHDNPPAAYCEVIGDRKREHIGQAPARRNRSLSLLRAREGRIDVHSMVSVLRDHGAPDPTGIMWTPHTTTTYGICIHAAAENRGAQTTGSMVSELGRDGEVHWVTGTAAPCLSIFKPILLDTPLPPLGTTPDDHFDNNALWWRHEKMHRQVLASGLAAFIANIENERNALEARFHSLIREVVNGGTATERARVVSQCWMEAAALENQWLTRIGPPTTAIDDAYSAGWSKLNRLAGIHDDFA